MEAIYAGILAWTIELTVAISILGILKREERKEENKETKCSNTEK